MFGFSGPVFARGLVLALILSSAVSAHKDHTGEKTSTDPCKKISGKLFVPPADALACQKSFPFNETLRTSVLQTVSRIFDFFTFEDYYLNSPAPFQDSTTNIRAELARIGTTKYATDYDFNRDLYNFANQLNDGHTAWYPNCYNTFQNFLPAPVVMLNMNGTDGVYVIPDLIEFIDQLGTDFTDYFDTIKFNWKRLAGAKVVSIEGMNPYDYIDLIAKNVSGNYLDRGVRANSVVSSYRIVNTDFSQRFGDLAGPTFVDQNSLTFSVIPINSTKVETVEVPYYAGYYGNKFTDGATFWLNNCIATSDTNGVDLRTQQSAMVSNMVPVRRSPLPRGVINDFTRAKAFGLPPNFQPNLPQVNESAGVIKSYILPDGKTGVMFIGSFDGDYVQFQTDTVSAIQGFKKAGVSHVLLDLTNNGGYICLGEFLHQYLAGSDFGYAGFQSTNRANSLAVKIVAANIKQNLTYTYYSPLNYLFVNGTPIPETYNYIKPSLPLVVNGVSNPTSQRYADYCTPFDVPIPRKAPFDLKNVAIVSNGNCASTCAMFSTVMNERHNTKIAVFGGKPGDVLQFKGMAGNQVLEWSDLDTEIRTAGLKNDPLAPPDLLVNANFRHNWRTAWSYLDETTPIAYKSELPKYRFAYTKDTYNNPQNLWTFVVSKLFG
ncbi:hypothetical protein BD410DRAFT_500291 [Rickenella mellea]|uniref:Tail specific protease domain-containing protein n=1 Tax=Rickenella mellea TaxID=50990 RepID=A0A4Y7PTL8_9AGAM|nr:hypothetical protein BD410DRAFT_500291 [Rickenella mellea]